MNAIVEQFGMAVRQLREQRGWSQDHLAALSGLNRSYVGEVERGRAIASLVTVYKLARALQLDAAELLAHSDKLRAQRRVQYGALAAYHD
jgi:transcriptional regulator with XRE-family HTH domain